MFSIPRLPAMAALALLFACASHLRADTGKQPAPPPITFEALLKRLGAGTDDSKLLQLVRSSPVAFTLGRDQVAKLREAGASDALIAELAKKPLVAAGSDVSAFVLILDCSGSMKEKTEAGPTKWKVALEATLDLLAAIPDGREVAFIAYGHDASRGCEAVDVLRPLSALTASNRRALAEKVKALSPQGHTPLALSLRKAGQELEGCKALSRILLITDGMETCHGDPNKEAAALLARHKGLRGVDVIGLGLNAEETKAVAQVAKSGKGVFHDAKTVKQLRESVRKIETQVAALAPLDEGEEAPKLSKVEKALVEQLKDKDRDVRAEAARSLAKRKAVRTASHLAKRIADDVWHVTIRDDTDPSKEAALEALKALAPGQVEDALLAAMKSGNASVKAWATNKIGSLEKKD